MKKALTILVALALLGTLFAGCTARNAAVTTAATTAAATTAVSTTVAATTASTTTVAATTTMSSTAAATTTAGASDSNFNESGYPIVNNAVTIKLFHSMSDLCDTWNDLSYIKSLQELTNVYFDMIEVKSASFNEKKNLALAGGDYPDVFWSGISTTDIYDYGVVGNVFIDYTDLIAQYMPNLQTVLAKTGNENNIYAIDGGIYSLPYIYNTATLSEATLTMRTDMAKKVGITETPQTIEEFYSAMVTFRDNANQFNEGFVPIVINNQRRLDKVLFTCFGDSSDYEYTYQDSALTYSQISEQNRLYLSFANKLFTEKLLDQEYFTAAKDQFNAKISGDLCAVVDACTLWTKANFPSGNYEAVCLPPLSSEYCEAPKWRAHYNLSTGNGVITSVCECPEVVARMFDVQYSEEVIGATKINCISPWLGLSGQDWELYERDGETYFSRITPENTKLSTIEYSEKYVSGVYGPCYLDLPYVSDPELDFAQNYFGLAGLNVVYPNETSRFPATYLLYTDDEMEDYNKLTDINTYVEQMRAQFITGFASLDDDWDAYVDQVNKMGIDDVLAAMMSSYNRMYSD